MHIQSIQEKEGWDEWFLGQKKQEFLQSWDWGEFQKEVGNQPFRFVFESSTRLLGIYHTLPFGLSYLYIPRSPRLSDQEVAALVTHAKEKGFIFIRLEPSEVLPGIKGSVRTRTRQPQTTLVLDLKKTEDALLEAMHAKTRYNIGLAARKGVLVTKEKNADIFWQLNNETTERDKFRSHGKEYYERMIKSPLIEQYIAWFEEKPIASILCVSYGNRYTYLHGASSNEQRNLMAPYLLQWHAIQHAKAVGHEEYDFWGIAAPVVKKEGTQTTDFHGFVWDVNHPWTGVTRFKVGFGGRVEVYPAALEIAVRPILYKGMQLLKKIRGRS